MTDSNLSRRTFVKGAGALGALAAVGSGAATAGELFGEGVTLAHAVTEEKTTWGQCTVNCPANCALKFHVVDDEVVWVDTYTSGDAGFDDPQPRACLRGRSYRAWMNHPDRLSYPMKRVGKRGEGKFERISWDEAVDIAASKLKEVIDTYGNEAVYFPFATGSLTNTARPFYRLMSLLGGFLSFRYNYSLAQLMCITPYMYGSAQAAASTLSAAEESKLILVFGSSPSETRQGGGASNYDWSHLRERTDAKVYLFDCRLSDSAMGHSDQWFPINPGTDAALVAAIANELIKKDLVDLDFLHTYCVGFDEETMPEAYKGKNMSYRAYVMGEGYDKVEKTAEWAAPITGISAERIKTLAEEIGTTKPLYVVQGYGLQRRSNGEWGAWSIMLLPCLVGQVGLPGTSNGCRERTLGFPIPTGTDSAKVGVNPLEKSALAFPGNPTGLSIPCFTFMDAIDHGPEMTAANSAVVGAPKLNVGIKYIINYAGNCLTNQHGDINYSHDVLSDESKCEFILGIDVMLTDSMKYADVLLPDLFRFEQVSMMGAGGDNPYLVASQPCTSPKFERKTAYEMAVLFARWFDIEEQFTEGKTEEDWLKGNYEKARANNPALPAYEDMMEMGVLVKKGAPAIAMAAFRKDPVASKLDTPSGKIEIFSEKLLAGTATWEVKPDDTIPGLSTLAPIPAYIPEWFGVETVTEEHPLMLTGFHYRSRTHSCWGNVEKLQKANPQEVWINPADAGKRGISSGDTVRVKNQFGEVEILAKVTPRIIPGVVAIPQGAWHDADMSGDRIDRGGCINTLTTHRPSPLAKGNPQHTNICEVRKA